MISGDGSYFVLYRGSLCDVRCSVEGIGDVPLQF